MKKSWLDLYLEYTKYSESPERFHLWTGISIIAATLGRNIFWDLGHSDIFPNLYIILVARSAGLKKTAAAEIGVDLLYLVPKGTDILADSLTNQYILSHLGKKSAKGEDASVFIYAEELSVFIGPAALSSGLIASLTKLYNCPKYYPYKTKTQGTFVLVNCCVNLLGASTPESLRLSMPSEALGGGFTGRIIFVTAIDKERCIAHPKRVMQPKEELGRIRRALVEDLVTFSDLSGEFVMTDEAYAWYKPWYETRDAEVDPDSRLVAYYERRHIALVKLGMILAVTKKRKYRIELEDLMEGLGLLTTVESTMIKAYEGITYSESTKHMDRVLAQIERDGEITHSRLLKRNYGRLSAEELKGTINTLREMESIEEFVSGKTRVYKFVKH